MILVPEIETVVILVPRTGSKSLRKALLATYPDAMQVYRHMEADGVPNGYDRWRRVGVVRDPVERLWSLYRYCKVMGSSAGGDSAIRDGRGKWEPAYVARQRRSAEVPFNEWIVNNETVFTSPYDSAGSRFWPGFTVRHSLPENRKSQFIYLRPDTGTEVWQHDNITDLANSLGVSLERHHALSPAPTPLLNAAAADHIRRFFPWDLETVHGTLRTARDVVDGREGGR